MPYWINPKHECMDCQFRKEVDEKLYCCGIGWPMNQVKACPVKRGYDEHRMLCTECKASYWTKDVHSKKCNMCVAKERVIPVYTFQSVTEGTYDIEAENPVSAGIQLLIQLGDKWRDFCDSEYNIICDGVVIEYHLKY